MAELPGNKKTLQPVYVVSSDHPLLVDRALAAVRDLAVPPSMRAWNYDVVEGKVNATRLLATCQTLPMMGAHRMVYVRDLAPTPADELAGLVPYLDAPNPSTVLFAVTSKLDARLKFYGAAKKKGFVHVLEAPRQVDGWIRAEAADRKARLAPGAVSRLAEAVGNDLSRLALCIDQLALYAGGREVTADDVDDLVADTRERTVFELNDAIGSADLPRALDAIQSMIEQRESGVGMLARLARHVRQLAMCHAAGGRDLASALGVPPFIADKLRAQSRRYQPDALSRATELIATADWSLKGFPNPSAADLATDLAAMGTLGGARGLGKQLHERVLMERLAGQIIALAAR